MLPPRTVSQLDGFAALRQIVDSAQTCVNVLAVEKTKQRKIAAYEGTEVAKIKAAESVLRQYFEQSFTERRAVFDGLLERLDSALEQGDGAVIGTVLNGTVDVARSSPLANAGDLSQIRAALDDPDHVWEL
ncbi:hypothetical protein Rrhod_4365 [Rhodococcus rhodnii LMG 5362]|uniref:Uncharacterized protein n=1 Tax=Rhodococcus rhodnii LMG 5362 TaxID=1273125 RepID=R7WGT2_9NOCA|nr:hypothetical protein Rrhod_4365 [Rhodococcus rhodnii LMG 5362]